MSASSTVASETSPVPMPTMPPRLPYGPTGAAPSSATSAPDAVDARRPRTVVVHRYEPSAASVTTGYVATPTARPRSSSGTTATGAAWPGVAPVVALIAASSSRSVVSVTDDAVEVATPPGWGTATTTVPAAAATSGCPSKIVPGGRGGTPSRSTSWSRTRNTTGSPATADASQTPPSSSAASVPHPPPGTGTTPRGCSTARSVHTRPSGERTSPPVAHDAATNPPGVADRRAPSTGAAGVASNDRAPSVDRQIDVPVTTVADALDADAAAAPPPGSNAVGPAAARRSPPPARPAWSAAAQAAPSASGATAVATPRTSSRTSGADERAVAQLPDRRVRAVVAGRRCRR